MSLSDLLRFKKINLPLGEEKMIAVAIPRYIGRTRWNARGIHLRANDIEDRDLAVGRFIKLSGYSEEFRITSNVEAWDGFYHINLIREKPPKEYKEKIARIECFSE